MRLAGDVLDDVHFAFLNDEHLGAEITLGEDRVSGGERLAGVFDRILAAGSTGAGSRSARCLEDRFHELSLPAGDSRLRDGEHVVSCTEMGVSTDGHQEIVSVVAERKMPHDRDAHRPEKFVEKCRDFCIAPTPSQTPNDDPSDFFQSTGQP